MEEVICAIIMAGGKEMRFGPVKNFLGIKGAIKIGGREEILKETISRCESITGRQHIYIVTNESQKQIIERVIGKGYFPPENFFIEPEPKNTAPCIIYSTLKLKQIYFNKKVIMCVFPADHDIPHDNPHDIPHDIPKEESFKKDIETAIKCASKTKKIITIGTKTNFPATGFGYIKYSNDSIVIDAINCHSVDEFHEKPNYDKAEEYHTSRKYFWNSGIFVWELDIIIEQYKKYQEEMYEKFLSIGQFFDPGIYFEKLSKVFMEIEDISFDKAILEQTSPNNIIVMEGTFKWDDIGKWDALLAIYSYSDNILKVDLIGVDITNKTIYSSGKYVYSLNTETLKDVKDNTYKWLYCNKGQESVVLKILNNSNYVKENIIKEFSSKQTEETREVLIKEMLDKIKANIDSKIRRITIIIKNAPTVIYCICGIIFLIIGFQEYGWNFLNNISTITAIIPLLIIESIKKLLKKLFKKSNKDFIALKVQRYYFRKYNFDIEKYENITQKITD
jgi:mannose-1-phosphate guanylyltransferase